jgi:MYXO-CTERM domain-containing protein
VVAVALSAAITKLALSEGPEEKAPAAAGAELEEAKRLEAEMDRLYPQGKYAQMLPLALRVVAIHEKALGPFGVKLSESLNNLAEVYRGQGDYAHAEPLLQRALAIREKVLGPDDPQVAMSLNNLGALYFEKVDPARAEPLFLRALAIREKTLGPFHSSVAVSLNNLAELYRSVGDLGRAEPLYVRALAILEKALGPDDRRVAVAVNNLAELYLTRGDPTRAESLHLRALAIREKALGPDHPDIANSLGDLANLYGSTGDLARAESLQLRALAIREKALGPDHVDVALALSNLVVLYLQQGRLPLAVSTAQQAADVQDRNASAVLATGSEDQKRLYMSKLAAETNLFISQHVRYAPADPDAARLALTVVLRRKGRVLDAMTDGLGALRTSLDPGDRALLDRLTSVYTRLTARVSRGPGSASPEQYRKELAALQQERQALEAEMGQRSAAFRAEQHLVTLPEVQAKIPRGAALVEIARYDPLELPAGRPPHRGAPRYVAYVLGPTGEPTFADLGEAAPLEAAGDTLRRALGDPDLTHDPKPAARALDRLLMAPIRALLGEIRWVLVSPDGALNLIPWGALVDESGHYLVERALISYLTTGRDLLRFGDDHARAREPPLILADPAFDDATAPQAPEATHRDLRSIDMVTRALPPLPSTADEARTIARLFPDSRVLLRAEATEEAVEAAHGPRFLHLATHGFFLPELPLPEALRDQRPGAEPTPAERAALLQRESPLLRSGIALAGFNRRKSGSDAGVLTALEAAGLDLHGTRLVVLSACETGLGEASTGEGVYGMRRALTMAGAESQVMSLWKVDTGGTRELMEAYYRRLADGAGRSEAMRAVQLAMLADPKTASPNLWAGFIVSGEWRPLDGKAWSPEVGPVTPGPRGCACTQAGGEPRAPGGWAALALGLWVRRRRRR